MLSPSTSLRTGKSKHSERREAGVTGTYLLYGVTVIVTCPLPPEFVANEAVVVPAATPET